jgi:Na+/melibiose symporter-like transporter
VSHVWGRLMRKQLERLITICLTLSILLPCVVYLFNPQLARNLTEFLAVWWFLISCLILAVSAVWYVGAYIVDLIRWRLDVRAEARRGKRR